MSLLKKISLKTKLVIGLIIVALLSYGGYSYWQGKKAQQATAAIKTVQVSRGDVVSTVSATGTLALENSVDVSSKITGRIVNVYVTENQQVKMGDLLIKLDDATLKSTLSQNSAKLANAEANYARTKSLYAQGAISKQLMDADEMSYQVAVTNYQISSDNLSDTIITAPINGIVIGKPTPVGQTVAPGISTPMILMTIGDMSSMRIEVLVDESDIGRIKQGQRVTFTVDSYQNEEFEGTVQLISRKSVTQQSVIYYTVYVKVKDAKNKLIPGMTARANILIDESRNTLFIPQTAVRSVNNQKTVQVMVQENGKDVIKEVQVQTGLVGENGIEIKAGLQEGDLIVTRAARGSAAKGQQSGRPPMRL